MKQIWNPILPLHDYIHGVEAHVFGGRIYLFGARDKEGAASYSMLDYVLYSAPVHDLADWRKEGVIFSAKQDPMYDKDRCYLYAPDVVCGNDGKYYLYYCLQGRCMAASSPGVISVAVSETPNGKYTYLGTVRQRNGMVYEGNHVSDPAVINDDGVIRLYIGSSRFSDKDIKPITFTLAPDMLTISSEVRTIYPDSAEHPFYEAGSIRKINGRYCYLYSSSQNHELCYAVSDDPDRNFEYRGVVISNGDIGYKGRSETKRLAMTGANHGSIEKIAGDWYVFYQRNTHRSAYSRQCCAEKIKISPGVYIEQVQMTSCGMNNRPLEADGVYPAAIACNLTNGSMPHLSDGMERKNYPSISDSSNERYVTAISNGTTVGFKFFRFHDPCELVLKVRGTANGYMIVSNDKGAVSNTHISFVYPTWQEAYIPCPMVGENAVYLTFKGKGKFDLISIGFIKN